MTAEKITVAPVADRVAAELDVDPARVRAALELLDGGATVPFVARYRKEATGGLDDQQLRTLDERARYLRELDERRQSVLDSIAEQGRLDDRVRAQVLAAETKARLEDVYLPFKPKRRTKAQIAREAGLAPLAELLWHTPDTDPRAAAADYVDQERGIADAEAALAGARSILIETFTEDADLVGRLRETYWRRGRLVTAVRDGQESGGAKYADYFDYAEPLAAVPSHRVLAALRGEKEEVLRVTLDPEPADQDPAATPGPSVYETEIAAAAGIADKGRAADRWLTETVRWAWRTRLQLSLGVDLRLRLRQQAEDDAVQIFATNLADLLLAAPAGQQPTLGLDPGYRTGVKVAVVDGTGKVCDTAVIEPHAPQRRWDAAARTLADLIFRHGVRLVAVGNGTASRETVALAREVARACADTPQVVTVSEAGASVYSASEYASRELPGMDVALRGAVSIARRLQDPLAELVKIDPKSIGVGQYQHDVAETKLARSLAAVVEDAVNAVGVDVNTASVPLLERVSGISRTVAENIVARREETGPFPDRRALKDVPRLGPKAFEQCAGFLRITGGTDPLDASAVHPEAYPVVRRILTATGTEIDRLMGASAQLAALDPADFADDRFGVPTVTDILAELDKPGRDPRPEFTAAAFADGVDKIGDLRPGMVLEGTVTNVAAFGAFVDVGVGQDGLVHVSAMSERFVSDPHEIVRSGQVVRVKVMEVDLERQRIGLSLRLTDEPGAPARRPGGQGRKNNGEARAQGGGRNRGGKAGAAGRGASVDRAGGKGKKKGGAAPQGAMADALRRAGLG